MGTVAGLGVHDRLALLRNARFRLLFVATFASGSALAGGDRAHRRRVRPHALGWWVGELLIANILPAVFIGLLFGPLVDRLSRKWLMIASDLGRLAVFAAAAVRELGRRDRRCSRSIAGIGNAFFRPAVLAGVYRTSLPRRSSRPQTRSSRSSTGRRPRSGRCSAESSSPPPGPNLAYWVNAVTFGFSAALVALHPGQAAPERAPDRPRPLERPRRGVHDRGPLARALLCARRLVDRDGRERDRERRGDLPRARSVPRRRSRFRAALDGLRCRARDRRARGWTADRTEPRNRIRVVSRDLRGRLRLCRRCAEYLGRRDRDGARRLRERRRRRREYHPRPAQLARSCSRARVHRRHERELRGARACLRRRGPVHERLRPALRLRGRERRDRHRHGSSRSAGRGASKLELEPAVRHERRPRRSTALVEGVAAASRARSPARSLCSKTAIRSARELVRLLSGRTGVAPASSASPEPPASASRP